MVERTRLMLRDNHAAPVIVVTLGMVLIAVLAAGALWYWRRRHAVPSLDNGAGLADVDDVRPVSRTAAEA